MTSLRTLLMTMVVVGLAVGGCRNTPPTEPTPEVEGSGPQLTVSDPVVEYRETESDEPIEVEEGDALSILPGAIVLTKNGGRASMVWSNFLTHEMLPGTDTLLSYSEPALRGAMFDQAVGTGRYTLEGRDEPAEVTVKAQWIEVSAEVGPSEFIVSLIPGETPSAWVAVVEGSVTLSRGTDTISVGGGQAVGVTEEGELPEVLEVDLSAVAAWYEEMAAGEAEGSIASVALRCLVIRDRTALRTSPDTEADAVEPPLDSGALVSVLRRDEAADWLYVRPITRWHSGWLAKTALVCNGPVQDAGSGEVEVTEAATPTETPEPLQRATATLRVVVPVVTATVTASPTPEAGAVVSFWADDYEIDLGDCTYIRWEVENIREVYLNGGGVPGGSQSRKVCPDEDRTYTLKVIHLDGREEEKSFKIEVNEPDEPEPSDTPRPATKPAATNTPAQLPTDVPTTPPPTPEPTEAPTQTQAPTEEPTAQPTEEATPEPTEEASPGP